MPNYDDNTELFYNQIRLIVVIFLFHALVFLVANLILKNFQCSFQHDDFITERNDLTISRFAFTICSFVGGLSLSAYILLPLSIFLNEILILFPNNFYVKWIDSELLRRLYISVHHGIKFTLFLIPYTFFLLQSSGIRSSSILSKSLESVSVVTILHFVIFVISWMALSIVRLFIGFDFINSRDDRHCQTGNDAYNFSYFYYFDRIHLLFVKEISYLESYKFIINLLAIYVHIAYSIFSFIGLIVSLISTPIGLISILIKIFKLFQSSIPVFVSRANLAKRLKEKRIDREYYDLVLKCQSKQLVEGPELMCQEYVTKIDQEIGQLQRNLRHFYINYFISWSKPILYFSLLICILLTLGTVVAFVFMNILELTVGIIWNIFSFFSDGQTGDANQSNFGRYFLFSDFSIGVKSSSKLGYFGALIQVILIHFLLITSVFGFFDGPIANKISIFLPIKKATTSYQLLANVSALLLLTSALPLQAVLLGFTAINPPEDIYNPHFSPLFANDIISEEIPEEEEHFFSWIYSLILWQDSYGSNKDRKSCHKAFRKNPLEASKEVDEDGIFANWVTYWFTETIKEEKPFPKNMFENLFSFNPLLPKFSQSSWNLLILLCYNIGFLATTLWIIKHKKSQDPMTEEFWRNVQNFVSPFYGARPWIRRNHRRNLIRKLSQ